jgi:hypothetical protein
MLFAMRQAALSLPLSYFATFQLIFAILPCHDISLYYCHAITRLLPLSLIFITPLLMIFMITLMLTAFRQLPMPFRWLIISLMMIASPLRHSLIDAAFMPMPPFSFARLSLFSAVYYAEDIAMPPLMLTLFAFAIIDC